MRSGQVGGASARMITAHFAITACGLLMIESSDHDHAVAEGLQRFECLGHFPADALGFGRPLIVQIEDPVRNFHERHADWPFGFDGKGRGHRIQHRQGDYRASSAQERPARNGFSKDYHLLFSSFGTECC